MNWQPVAGKHAIERVRIAGAFSTALSPKLVQRIGSAVEASMRSLGFGPMQTIEGQNVVLQAGMPAVQLQQPSQVYLGWQFHRAVGVGMHVEAFSVDVNGFFYEAAEYGRWDTFLQRYNTIANSPLSSASEFSDFRAVSLEYYDRFVFKGDATSSTVSDLLVSVPEILSHSVRNDGELWHLHRGWFEQLGGRKVLIQQNFDAGDGMFEGSPARSVGVMSRAEQRSDFGLIELQNEQAYLGDMHTRLNTLLSEVLTEEAKKSIGLEV